MKKYNINPLRLAAAERGWTAADVARAAGLDRATTWRTLSGHTEGVKAVRRIAEALGVPMSDLLLPLPVE